MAGACCVSEDSVVAGIGSGTAAAIGIEAAAAAIAAMATSGVVGAHSGSATGVDDAGVEDTGADDTGGTGGARGSTEAVEAVETAGDPASVFCFSTVGRPQTTAGRSGADSPARRLSSARDAT